MRFAADLEAPSPKASRCTTRFWRRGAPSALCASKGARTSSCPQAALRGAPCAALGDVWMMDAARCRGHCGTCERVVRSHRAVHWERRWEGRSCAAPGDWSRPRRHSPPDGAACVRMSRPVWRRARTSRGLHATSGRRAHGDSVAGCRCIAVSEWSGAPSQIGQPPSPPLRHCSPACVSQCMRLHVFRNLFGMAQPWLCIGLATPRPGARRRCSRRGTKPCQTCQGPRRVARARAPIEGVIRDMCEICCASSPPNMCGLTTMSARKPNSLFDATLATRDGFQA